MGGQRKDARHGRPRAAGGDGRGRAHQRPPGRPADDRARDSPCSSPWASGSSASCSSASAGPSTTSSPGPPSSTTGTPGPPACAGWPARRAPCTEPSFTSRSRSTGWNPGRTLTSAALRRALDGALYDAAHVLHRSHPAPPPGRRRHAQPARAHERHGLRRHDPLPRRAARDRQRQRRCGSSSSRVRGAGSARGRTTRTPGTMPEHGRA